MTINCGAVSDSIELDITPLLGMYEDVYEVELVPGREEKEEAEERMGGEDEDEDGAVIWRYGGVKERMSGADDEEEAADQR